MDETMGNQQGYPTEGDLYWLSGMLNGDGCFSLKFRTREGTVKCDLSVTLTQCDVCLIEKASSIMERLGVNPSIAEYPASGAGNRTKYNLRITKMASIQTVLNAIADKLAGEKQAQAKLMLRYVNRRIQFSDPTLRRNNQIADDSEAIAIAREFLSVRGSGLPDDVVAALNDYPSREYAQARGSARHA